MKILLTNNFGNAMKNQPPQTVSIFVKAIDKLENMSKPQILLQDTVTDVSINDEKLDLYTYHIINNDYAVFTFTPKNEMLLVDYVTLTGGNIKSVTYPNKNEKKDAN